MDVDVVVVGSGISGILCAKTLQEAGKVVTVLEAQDYIGGRTKTYKKYPEAFAEEGAEFVHGEHASTWKYIKESGLSTTEWAGTNRLFGKNGEIRKDSELLLEGVRQSQKGLYDYTGDEVSLAQFIDAQPTSDEAKFYAKRFIGDIEAADADKVSLTGFVMAGKAATNGSGNFWIKEGYSTLVEYLAKDLRIKVNSPVKRIHWNENGAEVFYGENQKLIAKRVVLTVPLGVVQARKIAFTPELPDSFYDAADRIGFGNTTKLTIWLKDPLPDFRIVDTDGLVGHFWLRNFGAQQVLVGFSGGSRAATLTSMDQARAIEEGITELCTAFGDDIRSRIADVRHFTWSNNPYVLGSYSYPALNMGDSRAELRRPIRNVIFYTGEATHAEGQAATVGGAIEEGVRAANKILGLDT